MMLNISCGLRHWALLLTPRGEEMMAGPYRIEDWGKTWLNPNKERVIARVPAIALPDIAGYWPQTTRAVRAHRSMPSASTTTATNA